MSGRSWVVSRIVVPASARSAARNDRSASLLTMSSPTVGSSSSSSSGECSSAAVDLAAHPLPERELPDRGVQERAPCPAARRTAPAGAGPLGRQPVDRGQQPERLGQRQVPPQLAALAEHDPDPPGQLPPLPNRLQPAHPDPARGRHEDPGEHLDRRRLAGAVRADVADALAGPDGERDPVHRPHDPLLPPKSPGRAADDEVPAQVLDVDDVPLALRALGLAHLPLLGRSRPRASTGSALVVPHSPCGLSGSLILPLPRSAGSPIARPGRRPPRRRPRPAARPTAARPAARSGRACRAAPAPAGSRRTPPG